MILLDALYVNNSGGKVLLDYLINQLEKSGEDVFYLLDKRCEDSYCDLHLKNVTFVESSIKTRLEFYKNDHQKFTSIFCFANIAPPVKCTGKVITYFHNLLLSEIPSGTPIKKRVVTLLKRFYAKRILKNTDEVWVQTHYSKLSFEKAFGTSKTVKVLPFYDNFGLKPGVKQKNSFLYVSDGNPHKNHSVLISAWLDMIHEDVELWLTVSDNYPNVVSSIISAQNMGCKIKNHQQLSRADLNQLYAKAEYIIYPSLLESFGLGLIEGALAGCKIVASDLPYVYEVVKPVSVFDPKDHKSITKAVKDTILAPSQSISELKSHNEIDKIISLLS